MNIPFLKARKDWLRVETVDRPTGGWDVVLVIDGTYFVEGREATVRFFEDWVAQELAS